jgi:hypothetical protein
VGDVLLPVGNPSRELDQDIPGRSVWMKDTIDPTAKLADWRAWGITIVIRLSRAGRSRTRFERIQLVAATDR